MIVVAITITIPITVIIIIIIIIIILIVMGSSGSSCSSSIALHTSHRSVLDERGQMLHPAVQLTASHCGESLKATLN